MLIANPKGAYSFLRGIAPYSGGAIADKGFEIVHVRFRRPIALQQGFERVRKHLSEVKRPLHALCGMELRSPQPFTFQGFNEFNAGYVKVLQGWGLTVDSMNPVARTNVAPAIGPPDTPGLHGFSYTISSGSTTRTFVVAGGGELPEGSLDPHDVVRTGETSADALREKVDFVMDLMSGRLKGLGVTWAEVTDIGVYTMHPICDLLADRILKPAGASEISWYYARPPIVSIEYEMDLRGCGQEIVIG